MVIKCNVKIIIYITKIPVVGFKFGLKIAIILVVCELDTKILK